MFFHILNTQESPFRWPTCYYGNRVTVVVVVVVVYCKSYTNISIGYVVHTVSTGLDWNVFLQYATGGTNIKNLRGKWSEPTDCSMNAINVSVTTTTTTSSSSNNNNNNNHINNKKLKTTTSISNFHPKIRLLSNVHFLTVNRMTQIFSFLSYCVKGIWPLPLQNCNTVSIHNDLIVMFAWGHLVLWTGALTSRKVLLPSTSQQNFFPT